MESRLIQLYWQNPRNTDEVILVTERQFDVVDDVLNWATEVFNERQTEMPAEWGPMVMLVSDDTPENVEP